MKDGKCVSAGGVVLQLLPGTSQENMDRAEERMQAFVNIADVMEKYGADGIMSEFFGGTGVCPVCFGRIGMQNPDKQK